MELTAGIVLFAVVAGFVGIAYGAYLILWILKLPEGSDKMKSISKAIQEGARAYLDVNCGHCHNPKGPANTSALDLTIFAAGDRHLGMCKPPVAAGRGLREIHDAYARDRKHFLS